MPLVVPGITSNNGDKSQDWQNQLMGKKLGETSDHQTFARKDLPKEARVVKQGDMVTMDHKPDRYVFFLKFHPFFWFTLCFLSFFLVFKEERRGGE